jgi:hypothetical protein
MIRTAQPGDEHAIMQLIHALAAYEKAPNEVINTAESLAVHLFEEKICQGNTQISVLVRIGGII